MGSRNEDGMDSDGQLILVTRSKVRRSVCQTKFVSSASVSEKVTTASPLPLPLPDPLSDQKMAHGTDLPVPTISPAGLSGGLFFLVPSRGAFRGGAI